MVLTLLPIFVLLAALPFRSGVGLDSVGLDGRTIGLLINTVGLAVVVSLLATIIGSGLALWLTAADTAPRRWARVLFIVPILMPTYVFALVWASVLGRQSTLNTVLDGIAGFRLSSYGMLPAVLALSLTLFPIATLTTLASVRSMDSSLIDAARISAPDPRVWRRIVVPQLLPGMAVGAILVFALTLVEYGVPALFQFNVYSMEVFADFSQDGDPVAALGTALPLLVVAGGVFFTLSGMLRRMPQRPRPEAAGGVRALERSQAITGWRAVAVAALLLATVLPVGVLAGQTGNPGVISDALGAARADIMTSLTLGVVAATAATLLALPLARRLGRRGPDGAWVLVILPLAVPAPLLAMGLIRIWSHLPGDLVLSRTPMLLLAHLGRLLPFAVVVLAVQFRRADPALFEAAQLHDVGWLRRLRTVYLPLMAPALIASIGVVFVLSLGELGASLLAVPPGTSTLPLRMFNLLHYGASGEVAALALTTVVIVIAVLGISARVVQR